MQPPRGADDACVWQARKGRSRLMRRAGLWPGGDSIRFAATQQIGLRG